MAQPLRATLDEIASTVPISATQSASIACEVSGRLDRWVRAKQPPRLVVPTLQDLTIAQSGSIWWWRGRSVPASKAVPLVGELLCALLQYAPAGRTPAGLLYVAARATEPGHLAPFRDLSELQAALARYAADERHLAIDALLARFQIALSGLPPLGDESSISDVRRLRRAGGVALSQIAGDTRIPVSLLRELEWGVFTNWDLTHARGSLKRYAERAGLDPEAVARVIVREQALVPAPAPVPALARASERRHRLMPFALAAALFAMVVTAPPENTLGRTTQTTRPAERTTAALTTSEPVAAISAERPTPETPRRTVKRQPLKPRRMRAQSPQARRPAARVTHSSAPLLRLARAIAGDGRYRAEPFPRPKATQ